MEIGFVVFHDGLVDEHVLNLAREVISFEYQEYQRLQEVLLFPEVQVILFLCYLERIHGDGLLFGVRDIRSLVAATDTFIRVTRINHNHICFLLQQLSDHAVHVETLATATRSDAEEVGIVRHLHLALFSRDVDTHRQPLAIGVVSGQRGIFRAL